MSSTAVWILIAVVLAVVLIAVLAMVARNRKRRSAMLQDRFGSEYDHALDETGRRSRAERDLQHRIDERERLDIRTLDAEERAVFSAQWSDTQALFVDDPVAALSQADQVVETVMQRRGYPVGDFGDRAALLSVDHSQVLNEYRAAHRIAAGARKNAEGERGATTEEMRRGMNHYRALFEDLLAAGTDDTASTVVPEHAEAKHRAVRPESPDTTEPASPQRRI